MHQRLIDINLIIVILSSVFALTWALTVYLIIGVIMVRFINLLHNAIVNSSSLFKITRIPEGKYYMLFYYDKDANA